MRTHSGRAATSIITATSIDNRVKVEPDLWTAAMKLLGWGMQMHWWAFRSGVVRGLWWVSTGPIQTRQMINVTYCRQEIQRCLLPTRLHFGRQNSLNPQIALCGRPYIMYTQRSWNLDGVQHSTPDWRGPGTGGGWNPTRRTTDQPNIMQNTSADARYFLEFVFDLTFRFDFIFRMVKWRQEFVGDLDPASSEAPLIHRHHLQFVGNAKP